MHFALYSEKKIQAKKPAVIKSTTSLVLNFLKLIISQYLAPYAYFLAKLKWQLILAAPSLFLTLQ